MPRLSARSGGKKSFFAFSISTALWAAWMGVLGMCVSGGVRLLFQERRGFDVDDRTAKERAVTWDCLSRRVPWYIDYEYELVCAPSKHS
jgi:hypothetical protein